MIIKVGIDALHDNQTFHSNICIVYYVYFP